MNNIKSFIGKGALAGLAGGTAAALFQWIVTEDQIRAALAIEAAAGADHGNELVSRSTQVIGGMVTAGIYGTLIGVVFAMAMCRVMAVGYPDAARSLARSDLPPSRTSRV